MFARKLQPNEYWRAQLNMAVAFESPFEFEKAREKAETAEESPKEALYGAFTGEDEPPVASIVMNRKKVRFDGHVLDMAGVGGVATLPAHRRGGAVRACMETSLREFYEEGCALSHLYPFSTAYYRQFGFASAGQSVRWKIKLQDLRGLPEAGGTVRQLFPGDDFAPLLDIYNRAYANVNFSCLREEAFDKELEGEKPLSAKRWIFLWSDGDGTPGGFLAGSRDKDTLNCVTDFAAGGAFLFTSPRALAGLLNFVRKAFISNFADLQFSAPSHIDMTALLPELSGMDCRLVLNGMARAVNVETVLRRCRCRGEGELVLNVSDPIIQENNGTFALRFAPGMENQVGRTGAEADVSLDVGNLAVLLGGARDADSIALTPDIAVRRETPAISQVFYRKPCHILDLF